MILLSNYIRYNALGLNGSMNRNLRQKSVE